MINVRNAMQHRAASHPGMAGAESSRSNYRHGDDFVQQLFVDFLMGKLLLFVRNVRGNARARMVDETILRGRIYLGIF